MPETPGGCLRARLVSARLSGFPGATHTLPAIFGRERLCTRAMPPLLAPNRPSLNYRWVLFHQHCHFVYPVISMKRSPYLQSVWFVNSPEFNYNWILFR
jgi:hypothetical protein